MASGTSESVVVDSTPHVASADDEMERVWRTESVSHAISRSRMLLPLPLSISTAVTGTEATVEADLEEAAEAAMKALSEEAGVTAIVLTTATTTTTTTPADADADAASCVIIDRPSVSSSSSVMAAACSAGSRLGLCVGVEAQNSVEMAAAAAAGAKFVLLRSSRQLSTEAEEGHEEGGEGHEGEEEISIASLLVDAAGMRCMSRMPVIPLVRDSRTLDRLVANHGVALLMWESTGAAAAAAAAEEEQEGFSLSLGELAEIHRDYGGTLRFICDAATIEEAAAATNAAAAEHGGAAAAAAAAAVLGVRTSWLADQSSTGVGSNNGTSTGMGAAAATEAVISTAALLAPTSVSLS